MHPRPPGPEFDQTSPPGGLYQRRLREGVEREREDLRRELEALKRSPEDAETIEEVPEESPGPLWEGLRSAHGGLIAWGVR